MQGKTGSLLNTAAELCEDGKFIEALKCYDKVLQIDSKNIKANIDKGVTLQNLGYLNQAIQCMKKY